MAIRINADGAPVFVVRPYLYINKQAIIENDRNCGMKFYCPIFNLKIKKRK